MNIANNKNFRKSLEKVCATRQNFLLQGKLYNLLSKSYYCVMENTTINAVNAAKTTLWQANVSNLLKILSIKVLYVNILKVYVHYFVYFFRMCSLAKRH